VGREIGVGLTEAASVSLLRAGDVRNKGLGRQD
jgi:hypothetical protein